MNAPVRRLWLAVALGYVALGATLQLLPTHVEERWGAGGPAVPLLVSVAFLATAAARPLAGLLVDAGRAHATVLAGASLTVAAVVVQWAAPSVPVLVLGRLAMGAGEGLLFSGALPWVLATLPPERRGRGAGWFGLSMWVGLTVGPATAALVGSTTLGWCVAVVFPLASLALVASLRSGLDQPRYLHPTTVTSRRLRASPAARLPGVYLGLCAYGYGTMIGLLAVHVRERTLDGDAALAVLAASFLVVRAAGSPAVDRFGAPRVAVVLAVVEAAGLAILPTARDGVSVVVAAGLVGAGVALAYPCAVALTLAGRTPSATSGTGAAVGTTTSWWDLGLLAAGLGGGVLALRWGTAGAFGIAAVVSAAAGVVALVQTGVHAAPGVRHRAEGDLP